VTKHLTSDGTRYFAYDDENQLTSVYVTNLWRCDFAYDGKLRRRIERDYSWNGSSWVETNEVHYVYDGNVVIQERDADNNPLVTYTRGNDLSWTLHGAGGIGGLLARTDTNGSAFYHADGNGNITCLIYTNQTIAAKYLYDPYGNTLSLSGPLAEANVYRFSSKEWNDNAGLYYYLYRYYDPNLQRWPNRDPLMDYGSTTYDAVDKHSSLRLFRKQQRQPNAFQFVNNDPELGLDLFGLQPWMPPGATPIPPGAPPGMPGFNQPPPSNCPDCPGKHVWEVGGYSSAGDCADAMYSDYYSHNVPGHILLPGGIIAVTPGGGIAGAVGAALQYAIFLGTCEGCAGD
jgi:RHS repeat-associated protein